jgi:hypothetical protein
MTRNGTGTHPRVLHGGQAEALMARLAAHSKKGDCARSRPVATVRRRVLPHCGSRAHCRGAESGAHSCHARWPCAAGSRRVDHTAAGEVVSVSSADGPHDVPARRTTDQRRGVAPVLAWLRSHGLGERTLKHVRAHIVGRLLERPLRQAVVGDALSSRLMVPSTFSRPGRAAGRLACRHTRVLTDARDPATFVTNWEVWAIAGGPSWLV